MSLGDEHNSRGAKDAAQTPAAAEALQKDIPTVQNKTPPVKRKAHEREELQDGLKGILTPRSDKLFYADRQALSDDIRPEDQLPDDINHKKIHFDLTKNTLQEAPREDDDIDSRISPDYAELVKLNQDISKLSEILQDPTHILHTMYNTKKEYSDRVARHAELTSNEKPTDIDSPVNWDHMIDAEINNIKNTGTYDKLGRESLVEKLNAIHPEYNKGIGKSHKDLEHDALKAAAGIVAAPGEGAKAYPSRRRSSVYIPNGREQGGGRSK